MLWIGRTSVVAVLVLLPVQPVNADGTAAIVEEISAPSVSLRIMDFVETGRVIVLRKDESIALGYLQSCVEERITGGRITIGSRQSVVKAGKVARSKVKCGSGAIVLDSAQAKSGAGVVFRKPVRGSEKSAKSPLPSLVLFAKSPIIRLSTPGGTVVIERVDKPASPINVEVRGAYLDLADVGKVLVPGGVYRARVRHKQLMFRIDEHARSVRGPAIGRILFF